MKALIFNIQEDKELITLKSLWKPRAFPNDCELIYEGQVPNMAFLVSEGEVYLKKRKQIAEILNEGSLVGLVELLNHTPFKYTLQVPPHAKLCLLDKFTLKQVLFSSENHPQVHQTLYPLVSAHLPQMSEMA